jgi:hypothetical protein
MAMAVDAPRFLCDAMLGRLATWLRVLGYDARYAGDLADSALVALAWAEGRILLTRDTRLVRRRNVGPHVLIAHDRVWDQVGQVAGASGLDLEAAPLGTRCVRCNVSLAAFPREAAAALVPPYVWETQATFCRCPACGRIYWHGTHRDHMEATLRSLLPSALSHQPPAEDRKRPPFPFPG